MTLNLLTELAAKSFLISGMALALLFAVKRRSAAERSWIAHAALLILLALPAALFLPRWRLLAPVTVPSSLPSQAAASLDPAAIALVIYGLAAGLLVLGTAVSVVRLFVLQGRADVVTDALWLTALARAQQRMGVRYGAALLVSGTVTSPLSWGLLRPTILLDTGMLTRPASAEAVITHELAHVRHLDWLKLLMARLVTAIFWFNPLVWVLARHCHQLREEAADDAVITADVPGADYASLLVEAARHENHALFFTAHGVAPGKHSLRQRVTRVLDKHSPRQTVSTPWAVGGLACIALIATPLAAGTLERAFVASPTVTETASPPRILAAPDTASAPPPESRPRSAGDTPRRARSLGAKPAPENRPAPAATTITAADGASATATDQARSLSFGGNMITVETGKPKPQTRTLSGNMVTVESPATGTIPSQDQ